MEVKTEGDNPAIGLILCPKHSKKMVQYFLGDSDKPIFASKYRLTLPTEKEPEAELKKEIQEFNRNKLIVDKKIEEI
jgi:hypothetical protein